MFHPDVQVKESSGLIYQCPGAALTQYHKSGSIRYRSVFPHSSGGQKSESKYQQDWSLWTERIHSMPLSCLPEVADNPWKSLVYRYITSSSTSIFTWLSSPRSVHIQISAHEDASPWIWIPILSQNDLILTWLYLHSPYFQMRSPEEGVRTATHILGRYSLITSSVHVSTSYIYNLGTSIQSIACVVMKVTT